MNIITEASSSVVFIETSIPCLGVVIRTIYDHFGDVTAVTVIGATNYCIGCNDTETR